ncbi:MAG: nucleotidyltransferase family protein [Clostridia bacterium]|nr:nucleotidyltransferase family protein [Clostridia bacterium]
MLDREQINSLTAIARHLLYQEQTPVPAADVADLRQLFYLHGMQSMIDCSEDPALAAFRKPENAFGHLLYQRSLDQTLVQLFEEMRSREIKAAVLKGAVINECYPPAVVRTSGDIDLFVPGRQREAFNRMMEELEIPMDRDMDHGQCGVDTYASAAGVLVEAHYLYFQRMSARQRKILRAAGCFSEDAVVPSADGRYCTLRPEMHLLYLIYHAGKHLMVHTITFRMLMDLTAFVNRYAPEIDAAAFRRMIRKLRFTRICNALMCFCMKHLGMRKDFWKKTGCSMEFFLRLMLNSGKELYWEQFIRRMPIDWKFYPNICIERDGEYLHQYRYLPKMALKNKYYFTTFVAWWALRLLWHCEVDFSGEVA